MDEQQSPVTPWQSHLPRLALLLTFAVLIVAGCIAQAAATPETREATISAGRQVFVANCVPCHGEKGDRVPVAPLNVKEFLDLRGDATLVHAIGEGKGVMPAWGQARGGPLSGDQISAVVAYLNASAGRTSPTLLASSGRTVFQQQCTRCHGDKGDRIPAAPLAGKAFLDSRTDAQLLDTINNGKGPMPAFRTGAANPLSVDQVQALVSYLRYNAETAAAGEAHLGRDLYMANCLGCHGERGDRVPNVTLLSPQMLRRLGDGTLTAVIANGSGVMPGFAPTKGGSLQATDIGAVLAYLKSSAGLPAGSALAGLEKSSQGRDLYFNNCAGCHGEGGDKVAGLSIKSRDFLAARADDALLRQIGQGNTRGMPAWGKAAGGPLSDDDIRSLISYLRSPQGGSTAEAQPPTTAPAVAPAASIVAPAPVAVAPVATDASSIRGKEIFSKNCVSCHGETRDKLAAAKLADAAWLQQRGDAALVQSITNGKGGMPAWGKEKGGQLSQDDVAAVVTYLKSPTGTQAKPNQGTSAPASGPSPANDAARGKEIFTKNCGVCHGDTRDKMASAKLADAAWLKDRGDAALAQSIANGKGTMPSWGKDKGGPLSQADITAVVAYLVAAADGTTSAPTAAAAQPTNRNIVMSDDANHGKDLFGKYCAACHGESRDMIAAARLADASWLQQRGDAALGTSIANGKRAMPAWGKEKGGPIGKDDIVALLAYFKEMAGGGS